MGENLPNPIGVFDSGVGGLSILKALRSVMPHENFVYVADQGHAPYGGRDASFIAQRTRGLLHHLLKASQLKAMVIACNTATAAAIHLLRQDHPHLPIVGVEPALKPAIRISKTRRIGVMATQGTLQSAKFNQLLNALAGQAEFICQACEGLASAIEDNDYSKIAALCAYYTSLIGKFDPHHIDTLVLGCTHYPFAAEHLQAVIGTDVQLVETGEPVARHTARLLGACRTLGVDSENRPQPDQFWPDLQPNSGTIGQKDGQKWAVAVGLQPTIPVSDRLLASRPSPSNAASQVMLQSSGNPEVLGMAARRWLGLHSTVHPCAW